jgi:hypothetical protein
MSLLLIAGIHDWIGTLPGWLTLITLVGAAWLFQRGGGSTAISSLEAANRVLERELEKLKTSDRLKDKELSELRGRTDVALAIAPIVAWTEQHEARAQDRHDQAERRADERQVATLNVLDLIADRLGPDELT